MSVTSRAVRLDTLAARITWARDGRPQAWLAQQLGVSRNCVWQWEHGRAEPSLATVRRIAEVTGRRPGWLAFGVGE